VIVAAVAVMYENVHQRTGRQEQPWQPRQDMRSVLAKQGRSADDGKGEKHELARTGQALSLCPVSPSMVESLCMIRI